MFALRSLVCKSFLPLKNCIMRTKNQRSKLGNIIFNIAFGCFVAKQFYDQYDIEDKFCSFFEKKKIKENKGFPLHYEVIKKLRQNWESHLKDNSTSEDPAQALIAVAEEIKTIYRDSHFVFIHAQSTRLFPIEILINAEADRQNFPKPSFFKYIRLPKKGASSEDDAAAIITSAIEAANENDHSCLAREHIISADAYFSNRDAFESAYFFLKQNFSIILREDANAIENLAREILSTDKSLSDKKKEKLAKFVNEIGRVEVDIGNLWIFCIPKDLVANSPEKILYRSHKNGENCNCHSGRDFEILKSLQDNILDDTSKCHHEALIPYVAMIGTFGEDDHDMIHYRRETFIVPQYRLIASNLTPENGVISFRFSYMPKERRDEIKRKIIRRLG